MQSYLIIGGVKKNPKVIRWFSEIFYPSIITQKAKTEIKKKKIHFHT